MKPDTRRVGSFMDRYATLAAREFGDFFLLLLLHQHRKIIIIIKEIPRVAADRYYYYLFFFFCHFTTDRQRERASPDHTDALRVYYVK